MSATFAPAPGALPPAQRELWPRLAPARALGYVLYGGTAIALRLGHRTSEDFDFFTDHPLDQARLRAAMRFLEGAETLREAANTLTVSATAAASGVKVSFFGDIRFGRVGSPQCTADGVVSVASLVDLMATKLKAMLQRVEAKDYRDVAAMLRAGVELPHGLACARRLFGTAFQPSESLKALTWFRGGDLDTLPADDKSVLIDAASRVRDLPRVELASRALAAASA